MSACRSPNRLPNGLPLLADRRPLFARRYEFSRQCDLWRGAYAGRDEDGREGGCATADPLCAPCCRSTHRSPRLRSGPGPVRSPGASIRRSAQASSPPINGPAHNCQLVVSLQLGGALTAQKIRAFCRYRSVRAAIQSVPLQLPADGRCQPSKRRDNVLNTAADRLQIRYLISLAGRQMRIV